MQKKKRKKHEKIFFSKNILFSRTKLENDVVQIFGNK